MPWVGQMDFGPGMNPSADTNRNNQAKTGYERLASYVRTKGFRAEIKRDEGVRKSCNQRNSGPLTLRSVPILESPAATRLHKRNVSSREIKCFQ